MKTVSCTIRDMPSDVWRQAKAKAALEGHSMKQVIIALLRQYVAQTEKEE